MWCGVLPYTDPQNSAGEHFPFVGLSQYRTLLLFTLFAKNIGVFLYISDELLSDSVGVVGVEYSPYKSISFFTFG